MGKKFLVELLGVSLLPDEGRDKWLTSAESGVAFVAKAMNSREVILHTSIGSTIITTVLAPIEKVSPPDLEDLARGNLFNEGTWAIDYTIGSTEPGEVYLSEPLDGPGCTSLVGGERLVFRRRFEGVDKGPPRIELNQRLIHGLGLYWLEEYDAFCRLDEHGDVDPVIRVIDLSAHGSPTSILVTMRSDLLHKYLAVTGQALVTQFDFTRVIPGKFMGWHTPKRTSFAEGDLSYHGGQQNRASYVNGILVTRAPYGRDELHRMLLDEWHDAGKQYAVFKAQDWKHNRLAELSCDPAQLASYFDKDSLLPLQITPAFFRPEVLQRYKADPEKYKVEHRSISSRAGWYLKTYDINEAGQVHTYLRYLGDLPYSEQIYWQSFNEWPKAPISERAYKTDFEASWDDTPDPLLRLQTIVRELDESPPDWWDPRGTDLLDAQHYPVTASIEEWANAILALDQLLVEGLSADQIRKRLARLQSPYETSWASLKLIEKLLVAQGEAEADAKVLLEPLKQLHYLRSKVKGHAATTTKAQLVRNARKAHGGLKEHFRWLVGECDRAFARVTTALNLSV